MSFIDKRPLQLSEDFKNALDLLEKNTSCTFITGKAGTGKSTLLKLFKSTTKKKCTVVAPTGIAALNVQGQTIHSFFGFPAKPITRKDIKKRRNYKLYRRLEVIIIDEVSMVRADIMDNIDYFLRVNRENPLPFGGVQMIFFGDMFQLPPIVSNEIEQHYFKLMYDNPYFFAAHVFNEVDITMHELQKVYRQEERHFLRLLDAIRTRRFDQEDLDDLNERYLPYFKPKDYYITLSPRNATVDSINQKHLGMLETVEFIYTATINGKFNPNQYPTDPFLTLKTGAQVMFIKNDPDRQFVNGTLGKVIHLTEKEIEVAVQQNNETDKVIKVERIEWEILKYKLNESSENTIETEVLGTFTQYPLRLAWAITIHKSQGKTFDKAIIDMGRGAFESGQTYVALSRCRTLDGIVLKYKIRPKDIIVDERIVEFYDQHFH